MLGELHSDTSLFVSFSVMMCYAVAGNPFNSLIVWVVIIVVKYIISSDRQDLLQEPLEYSMSRGNLNPIRVRFKSHRL